MGDGADDLERRETAEREYCHAFEGFLQTPRYYKNEWKIINSYTPCTHVFRNILLSWENIISKGPEMAKERFIGPYGVTFVLNSDSDELKRFEGVIGSIHGLRSAWFRHRYITMKDFMVCGNAVICEYGASATHLFDKVLVMAGQQKEPTSDLMKVHASSCFAFEDYCNYNCEKNSIVADVCVDIRVRDREKMYCELKYITLKSLAPNKSFYNEASFVTPTKLNEAYNSPLGYSSIR